MDSISFCLISFDFFRFSYIFIEIRWFSVIFEDGDFGWVVLWASCGRLKPSCVSSCGRVGLSCGRLGAVISRLGPCWDRCFNVFNS